MKNLSWKQILPHVAAIVVFILVAVIYCKPAFQGQVLQQSDVIHWQGMAQDAITYHEQHGHYPLWNTHLFSGMPNYVIAMDQKTLMPLFNNILSLGLPKPASYFFIACLCFYLLCMAYRANYLVGILGSLAFAYCSFNPVIVMVGHDTQMLAIAYMPGVLAGLVWLYRKKYIIGLAITSLFASLEIFANHPQVNYYLAIAAGFLTVSYLIFWIRNKEWKHAAIAVSLALLSALIGIGNSAVNLLVTSEYAKYTMRGGKTLDNTDGKLTQVKTEGLDEDYAFQYSVGKSEFLMFMMPKAFGGSSSETYDESSKLVSALTEKGVPETNAVQLAQSLPKYWGGILSTSGPVYFGVVICILFIIGMVVVSDKQRWWILAASVFAVLMATGKYLPGFNGFLFHNLPLYNKFRAPSMSLVIPQLLFPLLAVLCLQSIFFKDEKKIYNLPLKKILYAVGGVFAVIVLIYFGNDYSSQIDGQIQQAYNNPQAGDLGKVIINALTEERKAMFGSGLIKALLFAAGIIGLIYLYSKNKLKPVVIVTILLLVNTIDLFAIDTKYLSSDNYTEPEAYTANFNVSVQPQSGGDPTTVQQLQSDKNPHFRIFNLAPDRYNESILAYTYRCIGGYNPAKLRIYQDLIENQLSDKLNMSVLNMLDTKYFFSPTQRQQNEFAVQRNDSAMGACWFVNDIKYVNGPVEEMNALTNFNPAQTAIVDNSFKALAGTAQNGDNAASIRLSAYDNDDVKYTSQSSVNRFAVFSEVYYPAGWNAYIDGKKTDYCKVNYVLRGMSIPAGKHTIEFKFEPAVYYKGQIFNYIAFALLLVIITGAVFYLFRKQKTQSLKAV